jgi:TolB protein
MRALLLLLALPLAAHSADGTLLIKVLDKATHQPLAARISVKASDGQWRWGKDAAGTALTYGGAPRLWSTGETTLTLPEGPAEIVVSRPFHHRPAKAAATVEAGKTVSLTIELERAVDIHARGWFGGDIHVHIVHGEKDFKVDLPTVVPIARAEGQDWCSFGQAWTSLTDQQPTPLELDALTRKLSTPDFLAGWGMEHPKDHLGHMAAFPLNVAKNFTEASGSNDYHAFMPQKDFDGFTHVEIWRGLRAHGSLAVYTHPTREYGGTPQSLGNIARELPFDVLAAPDWFEALDILCDQPRHANDEALAYVLLNRGLRFAICGFTDVCYDRRKDHERPGDTRTYVYLGENRPPGPLTFAEIVAAVRARKTFATNGPLVDFKIDGERPGSLLKAGPALRQVHIGAWLAVDYADPLSAVRIESVEVLRNGVVWNRYVRENNSPFDNFEFTLQEKENAWYAVRVRGSDPQKHFALTSPIWFETEDYKTPQPLTSQITVNITDAATAEKLAGTLRVIEYSALDRKELSRAIFKDGRAELDCPAAARIEISAEGYEPQLLSPFLHSAVYKDHFLAIRRTDLLNPKFYDQVKTALEKVELNAALKKK